MSSIDDAIGGLPALEVAVQLSERVVEDSELASFFVGMDVRKLKSHLMAHFDEGAGSTMPRGRARLHKEQRYFDAVARHFSWTLREFGMDDAIAVAVLESVLPLATQIVSTRAAAAN